MKMPWRGTFVWIACASMVGCAMTPQQFRANPGGVSNLDVCRTWDNALKKQDKLFAIELEAEATRRGLDAQQCVATIKKANEQAATAVAVIALIGLAVAASRGGGGGGGGTANSYSGQTTDYEWDWDQFRDQYGQFVWMCRGVQTGQFAELHKCSWKAKSDRRWPGPTFY